MRKLHWYGQDFVPAFVKYCLILDPKQYAKEMARLHMEFPSPYLIPGSAATTHFADEEDGDKSIALVCMDLTKRRTINEMNALLVHEAVHIYQEMMRSMRENDAGKEIEAFYIQRISLDLMAELDDYFKENPHAHPDYRKHHKARGNVVRRRG